MKKTIYGAILFIALIFTINGCGGGGSTDTKTYTKTYTNGTINYADGSVFGITKAEASVNGGFNIYDIELINTIIGFIRMDGFVTDISGFNIGVCSGATISDRGVSGTCAVPIANPYSGTANPQYPTSTECTPEALRVWEAARDGYVEICTMLGANSVAICEAMYNQIPCVQVRY